MNFLIKDTNLTDRLKIVLSNNPSSGLGNIAIAFIFYLLTFKQLETPDLHYWLGYMVVVSFLRVQVGRYYLTHLKESSLFHVLMVTWISIVLVALGWAGASLMFFNYQNPALVSIILITMSGLSAASVSSLSAIRFFFHSFLFIIILPIMLIFFFHPEQYLIGFIILIYWLFLVSIGNKSYQNMLEIFKLNSDNLNLIQSLQEQKGAAEKANALKSEFLANMSHEIRTPMNAILGFSQILRESEVNPEKLESLNSIQKAGDNLLQIINDILDFSRLEKSQLAYQKETFSPKRLFKELIHQQQANADKKGIELHLELSDDLPQWLLSDPLRIKQVLSNLVSNAIKFSNDNEKVEIKVYYDQALQKLHFQVKDNGIGIPKDKQQTIFKPFVQVDSSSTRKYGGTGLGLAICSRILQDFQGRILLESEENQGSLFSVEWPCPLGEPKTAFIEQYKQQNALLPLQGRVLIVEDDLTNQILLKKLLEKMGLQYEIANNGLQAVAAYSKNDFNLILMDENMPKMTGIEATKAIRNIEKKSGRQHQIIIALTANALKEDRERFLSAGMDEYLTKPVKIDLLNHTLAQFLPISEEVLQN